MTKAELIAELERLKEEDTKDLAETRGRIKNSSPFVGFDRQHEDWVIARMEGYIKAIELAKKLEETK